MPRRSDHDVSGLQSRCRGILREYDLQLFDRHQTAPVTYGVIRKVGDQDFVLRIPANLDLAGAHRFFAQESRLFSSSSRRGSGKKWHRRLGRTRSHGRETRKGDGRTCRAFTTSENKAATRRDYANEVVFSRSKEMESAPTLSSSDCVAADHDINAYLNLRLQRKSHPGWCSGKPLGRGVRSALR
jgi:hypothetical protein